MSLRDLEIKIEYRSLTDNIVKDFYIPLLKESIIYKRAVGFFSSTSLVEISKGIAQLAQNGGKIKIVASPSLSEEDINAIRSGYARREVIIQDKLLASLADIDTYDKYSKTRLNLLANPIAMIPVFSLNFHPIRMELTIAMIQSHKAITNPPLSRLF